MGELIQREGSTGAFLSRGSPLAPACRLLCALNSISCPLRPMGSPPTMLHPVGVRTPHRCPPCCWLTPGRDGVPRRPGSGLPSHTPGQARPPAGKASENSALGPPVRTTLAAEVTIEARSAGRSQGPAGAPTRRGLRWACLCALLRGWTLACPGVGTWSRKLQA